MLSTFETMLGRPRTRTWIPLVTQQLRLRHLIRVIAYNIKITEGSLYYTLHFTTMCAPFYTSEKLESQNPKWAELDINSVHFSSATGLVLRVWLHKEDSTVDKVILAWGICLPGLVYLGTKLADIQPVSFKENTVIFQLNGGYFTSQHCIRTDTVKPLPFVDNLNIIRSDDDTTSIVRNASIKCAKNEVKSSYNVKKLQRLHSLQQSIKNKTLDAEDLREKISAKCGLVDGVTDESIPLRSTPTETSSQAPRLLSMTSINRLLNKQEQPTRIQRQEIARIRKLIESARFRTKLLAQERDRKLANLRRLNQECNLLLDSNEDKNSELMSLYRQLSRDMERLREWRRSQTDIRELFIHTSAQLYLRRKQLVNQLLLIYPIQKINGERYTISGVHLPDSENLYSVPESSLSVALGYVTHVVVMCSTFLQVPLRYPLIHLGSRSRIIDHITVNIPDKEREFPLYTKGKDRLQFQYAVYLLNKNIAQLRWYCGLPTHDLRATLSNLLTLLEGSSEYRYDRPDSGFVSTRFLTLASGDQHSDIAQNQIKKFGSFTNLERSLNSSCDPLLLASISNSCEHIFAPNLKNDVIATPVRKNSRSAVSESGPGLSQILAPGNFLSSPGSFFKLANSFIPQKIGISAENLGGNRSEGGEVSVTGERQEKCDSVRVRNEVMSSSCVDCNIEQGLDILDGPNNLCAVQNEHSITNGSKGSIKMQNELIANGTEPLDLAIKLKRRISRSVGSYTDEEKYSLGRSSLEVGSDPLLINSLENPENNLSDQSLPNSLGEGRKEFLQHWFNSSPALVCSEEHLCPEEFLGIASQVQGDEMKAENALTVRTDALLETNSTFHLVKPKH